MVHTIRLKSWPKYLRGWAVPKPYIEYFFPYKNLSQHEEYFNFFLSKPKSDKVATNFFATKSFLKMILSTSRKGCHFAKNSSFSSKSLSKTQNGDQNRIYPWALTLQTAKFFPFKRVFFNLSKTDLPFRFCKIGLRNTLVSKCSLTWENHITYILNKIQQLEQRPFVSSQVTVTQCLFTRFTQLLSQTSRSLKLFNINNLVKWFLTNYHVSSTSQRIVTNSVTNTQ